MLNEASQHTLNAHLDLERQHFVRNLHHANAGEGISAFLESAPTTADQALGARHLKCYCFHSYWRFPYKR